MPYCNSNKYKLKLISETDSRVFYDLIRNNQSRLEDFFAGTISKTKTLECTERYCKEIVQKIKQKEYFPYLIIDVLSNQPIGLIDLKNINWDIPKGELGAFIDSNFEGKGLITSLAKDLIDKIVKEHKFKKLLCRVAKQNERSIRVVERIGFKWEGTIKRDYKTTKGEIVDLNYYGRLFN